MAVLRSSESDEWHCYKRCGSALSSQAGAQRSPEQERASFVLYRDLAPPPYVKKIPSYLLDNW